MCLFLDWFSLQLMISLLEKGNNQRLQVIIGNTKDYKIQLQTWGSDYNFFSPCPMLFPQLQITPLSLSSVYEGWWGAGRLQRERLKQALKGEREEHLEGEILKVGPERAVGVRTGWEQVSWLIMWPGGSLLFKLFIFKTKGEPWWFWLLTFKRLPSVLLLK